MAKLTAARRNSLPKSSFGEPGKRAYPMPDRSHAANAKARASQAVKAGRMSPGEEARIDAKANRMLGKGRSNYGDAEEGPRQRPRAGARDGLGHGKGGLAVHSSARSVGMHNNSKTMMNERY